jgi:hypothetical protein
MAHEVKLSSFYGIVGMFLGLVLLDTLVISYYATHSDSAPRLGRPATPDAVAAR